MVESLLITCLNFTLGLTNPSTQSDLLKVEAWKEKILLYKDAVSDPGNGISAVSHTWAKKTILGMSDEEVKLDLQQQRFEKRDLLQHTKMAAQPLRVRCD